MNLKPNRIYLMELKQQQNCPPIYKWLIHGQEQIQVPIQVLVPPVALRVVQVVVKVRQFFGGTSFQQRSRRLNRRLLRLQLDLTAAHPPTLVALPQIQRRSVGHLRHQLIVDLQKGKGS